MTNSKPEFSDISKANIVSIVKTKEEIESIPEFDDISLSDETLTKIETVIKELE